MTVDAWTPIDEAQVAESQPTLENCQSTTTVARKTP
jgi:hypothetical protein